MPKSEIIISDWNGTLIEDKDEALIFEFIGRGLIKGSFPLHPVRFLRLLGAKRKLGKLSDGVDLPLGEYGVEVLRQMYEICNSIIRGVEIEPIIGRVNAYASDASRRLEERMLRPIREAHRASGKKAGILSIGYRYGIDRILSAGGYRETFDFIEANELETNGSKVSGLSFHTDKVKWLQAVLSKLSLSPDETIYIGDSGHDEPCFEIVRHPIVSFLASDDFKQHCARKFGDNCVPESETDLLKYLQSI